MSDIVLYLGITIVGYIIGSKLRNIKDKLTWTGKVQTVAITLLVFVMGLRIGANKEVVDKLDSIGLYAFAFTVVVMITTVIAITIARKILGIDRYGLMKDPTANMDISEESAEVDEIENISVGGITATKPRKIDPMTIIRMIQGQPRVFQMDGPDKLRLKMELPGATERLTTARSLLESLVNS